MIGRPWSIFLILICLLEISEAQISSSNILIDHNQTHPNTQSRKDLNGRNQLYTSPKTKPGTSSTFQNSKEDYEENIIRFVIKRTNKLKNFDELLTEMQTTKDNQTELENLIKQNKLNKISLPQLFYIGKNQVLIEDKKPISFKLTFNPKATVEINNQKIVYENLPLHTQMQKIGEALLKKKSTSHFLYDTLVPPAHSDNDSNLEKFKFFLASIVDITFNQYLNCQESTVKLNSSDVKCKYLPTKDQLIENFEFLKSKKFFLPNELNCKNKKLTHISSGPVGISFVYNESNDLTEMKVRNPSRSIVTDCQYIIINNLIETKYSPDCPLEKGKDFAEISNLIPILRMMDCCKEGTACSDPVNEFLFDQRTFKLKEEISSPHKQTQ